MTTRRVRLEYSAASVVISLILSIGLGAWYFSSKLDEAFGGLCDILVISTEPYPKPPQSPNVPPPTTEYGKALSKYNKEVEARQQRALAAVNRAVDKYHCR